MFRENEEDIVLEIIAVLAIVLSPIWIPIVIGYKISEKFSTKNKNICHSQKNWSERRKKRTRK